MLARWTDVPCCCGSPLRLRSPLPASRSMRCASRATSARTRRRAPSGGTSPASCAAPARARSASRSRSSARASDATQAHAAASRARQLLFAHAAVTDLRAAALLARPAHRARRLRHRRGRRRRHRRAAARLALRARRRTSRYRARAAGATRLRARPALRADPAGAAAGRRRPVAQGPATPAQASHYYSEPQLAVQRHAGAATAARFEVQRHAPGSTTNGARRCCIPTRSAGTGSA